MKYAVFVTFMMVAQMASSLAVEDSDLVVCIPAGGQCISSCNKCCSGICDNNICKGPVKTADVAIKNPCDPDPCPTGDICVIDKSPCPILACPPQFHCISPNNLQCQ